MLPGIGHSEKQQEARIQELEVELKASEEKRREAVKIKEEMLGKLDEVIRSIKRP